MTSKVCRDSNRTGGRHNKATLFWENKGGLRAPIGMDLTPPGYKHGDGVFVVGKTKLLLITDTDGDGKADKETPVSTGYGNKGGQPEHMANSPTLAIDSSAGLARAASSSSSSVRYGEALLTTTICGVVIEPNRRPSEPAFAGMTTRSDSR